MNKKWGNIITIILAVGLPLSVILAESRILETMDTPGTVYQWIHRAGSLFMFAIFFYLIFPTRRLYLDTGQKGFLYLSITFAVNVFFWFIQNLITTILTGLYRSETYHDYLVLLSKFIETVSILSSFITYFGIPLLFLLAVRSFSKEKTND